MNPKEYLCWYDPRNPNYIADDEPEAEGRCYCDNCFYNRSVLAKEILALEAKLVGTISIKRHHDICNGLVRGVHRLYKMKRGEDS